MFTYNITSFYTDIGGGEIRAAVRAGRGRPLLCEKRPHSHELLHELTRADATLSFSLSLSNSLSLSLSLPPSLSRLSLSLPLTHSLLSPLSYLSLTPFSHSLTHSLSSSSSSLSLPPPSLSYKHTHTRTQFVQIITEFFQTVNRIIAPTLIAPTLAGARRPASV